MSGRVFLRRGKRKNKKKSKRRKNSRATLASISGRVLLWSQTNISEKSAAQYIFNITPPQR
jgi:hypothetical protein